MIKRKSNPGEVLIVVSKLKGYIAGKGWEEGSTPQEVMDSFLNIKEERVLTQL